jgi:hypothetical protein
MTCTRVDAQRSRPRVPLPTNSLSYSSTACEPCKLQSEFHKDRDFTVNVNPVSVKLVPSQLEGK